MSSSSSKNVKHNEDDQFTPFRVGLHDVFSADTQFVPAGTLIKPSIIGRLVRLAFGVAILVMFAPSLLSDFSFFRESTTLPTDVLFLIAVALGFVNTNHVVNLGLGRSWGHRPQFVVIILGLAAVVIDAAFYGTVWAPPLGLLTWLWMVAIFLPLGLAFMLAALIATPGCEMRSYHHLATIVLRQDADEHFCPGGVDFADHWELNLRRQFRKT